MWRYRVLIVEDDPTLTDEFRFIKGPKSTAIWVSRVSDVREVVRCVTFDVVVSLVKLADASPPRGDSPHGDIHGLAVTELVKERRSWTPAVIVYYRGAAVARKQLVSLASNYGAEVLDYPSPSDRNEMIAFADQLEQRAKAIRWKRTVYRLVDWSLRLLWRRKQG